MTQTIAIKGTSCEINPLYIKLRRRFARAGDRTIGEEKVQEAIREGYSPYGTPVSPVRPHASAGAVQAEKHLLQGNHLPQDKDWAQKPQRTHLSGGVIAIILLCAGLLLALLFFGSHISRLNHELSDLRATNTLLIHEAGYSVLPASGPSDRAAAPAGDAAAETAQYWENLTRAFSEN